MAQPSDAQRATASFRIQSHPPLHPSARHSSSFGTAQKPFHKDGGGGGGGGGLIRRHSALGVPTKPPGASLGPGGANTARQPSPATAAMAPAACRRNKCTTELTPGAYLQGKQATYYLHCVLGKGCFAEVFKAETLEKKTYAIKVIPREKSVPKQHYEDEANRLQALCHPNVVSALEAFTHHGTQATYCCIVTEFCGGGTLLDRIKRQDPAEFTPKQITRYLYQIASGLDYLHSSGYMHGDLKSDNILLTRKRQPKISDFGHSRLITEGTDGDKPVGDLMFAPPEYTRARMVSAAFDMWSLGCILCEMATRRTTHSRSVGMPFAANRPAFGQMMQEIRTVHGGTFLPLIQELCEVDPKQRMSAARVVEYAEGMGGAVEPRDNDDGDRHGIIRRMLRELKESMRIDM